MRRKGFHPLERGAIPLRAIMNDELFDRTWIVETKDRCIVRVDGEVVYSGRPEDIPDEIREMTKDWKGTIRL